MAEQQHETSTPNTQPQNNKKLESAELAPEALRAISGGAGTPPPANPTPPLAPRPPGTSIPPAPTK
jgi:hypothetical protein